MLGHLTQYISVNMHIYLGNQTMTACGLSSGPLSSCRSWPHFFCAEAPHVVYGRPCSWPGHASLSPVSLSPVPLFPVPLFPVPLSFGSCRVTTLENLNSSWRFSPSRNDWLWRPKGWKNGSSSYRYIQAAGVVRADSSLLNCCTINL